MQNSQNKWYANSEYYLCKKPKTENEKLGGDWGHETSFRNLDFAELDKKNNEA